MKIPITSSPTNLSTIALKSMSAGERGVIEAAHQGAEVGRAHALGERCRASDVGEEQRALDFGAAMVGLERAEAAFAVLGVLGPPGMSEVSEDPAARRPERCRAHLAARRTRDASMPAAEPDDAWVGTEQEATPDLGLGYEIALVVLVRHSQRALPALSDRDHALGSRLNHAGRRQMRSHAGASVRAETRLPRSPRAALAARPPLVSPRPA